MTSSETGSATGTKDKDYNLIWFVEACLSNALRMEDYAQDAERDGDSELADFSGAPRGRAARVPSRASSCSRAGSTADPGELAGTPVWLAACHRGDRPGQARS